MQNRHLIVVKTAPAMSATILCQAVCVHVALTDEQGRGRVAKYQVLKKPTFFCSSSVNSEPARLCPEVCKSESKNKTKKDGGGRGVGCILNIWIGQQNEACRRKY